MDAFRCPECGSHSPVFRAMTDAVLAVAGERSVEHVLRKLVDEARTLVDARYAALGVPDGEGGFAQFLTSGMSKRQLDALGELPRAHGMLGAMLAETAPFRTADIQQDPRFQGWPPEHPSMHSFLGVPIVSKGTVIGSFYLTDKRGGRRAQFTEEDERVIEALAAHAAIAIENARLHERSRELSTVEERKRLARELHDSVTQTLFSVSLTAEAAATLLDSDPDRAKAELEQLRELARGAMEEMRALIFELRPAELEADGLVPALRKHVEVLRRIYEPHIELAVDGEWRLDPALEKGVLRIAQEALGNALKHAGAARIDVAVRMPDGRVELAVSDDGRGFDPVEAQARSRRLGLVSMRERAEELGGALRIDSGPGRGTTVTLEVPRLDADPRPAR
jgi:signal transduction histidine kinase